MKKNKRGMWKRRIGSKSKKGLDEGNEETRQLETKKVSMGKRGFNMIDEDD